jgi:hypothetical protein
MQGFTLPKNTMNRAWHAQYATPPTPLWRFTICRRSSLSYSRTFTEIISIGGRAGTGQVVADRHDTRSGEGIRSHLSGPTIA